MSHETSIWPVLRSVAAVVKAPLDQIADRLRQALTPLIPHRALVIFTEDCTGRPQKKAGDEDVISRVSIDELDALRANVNEDEPWEGDAVVGGKVWPLLVLLHGQSRALLVIVDPRSSATVDDREMLTYLWNLAAGRIQEKVADAPPSYLLESRAASAERVRVTTELTDLQSTTLETLLAALRSPTLDDTAARSVVTDLTAEALIRLRTLTDRTADRVEEPVHQAFERLRDDLRPLTRFKGIDVEFVEPPRDGRALPGEVAHAARAIVRGTVLAMMEQSAVTRVRTQWGCDGENLLINIRDDGGGELAPTAPNFSRLDRQTEALAGHLTVESTSGWGTSVSVSLPLDPPATQPHDIAGWNLASRELEVLQLLAAGKRNRAIALSLRISENTVKFHVRKLFQKMNVASRAEAIAIAHAHGIQ